MANQMGIESFDYVEFYVGSAKMTAYWFVSALGFKLAGYVGPETGSRDRMSFFLTQNDIKMVVTSALQPQTYDISSFVTRHGDGVKRFVFRCASVEHAYHTAVKHGAIPVKAPFKTQDEQGWVEEAFLLIYGRYGSGVYQCNTI